MKVCFSCQRCYDDPAAACSEIDHPALSETRPGSCEMIAGYRLEVLLDTSGNCETFLASARSGQPCFIKILAAGDECLEEFQNEAEKAAKFFHPNVAEVYEAGTLAGGDAYVVTEKPDGQTLRELLNNVGVPSLLTSIQAARQAAEALYALHENGLIHGSVNPENIVLTSNAEQRLLVKLQHIDFGAARTRTIVSNKFLKASELNYLKYFAPELSAGEAASEQSDVYGLGVVFYEMLAGFPPFDAPTAAGLIDQHKNHQPPEISIDKFDLRMLITHTLKESLQKQPKLRHPTANALARQLRHIEQLATHISTPPAAGAVPPALVRHAPIASKAAASGVPSARAVKKAEAEPLPRAANVGAEPVSSAGIAELSVIEKKPAAAVDPVPVAEFSEPQPVEAPEVSEFKAAPVRIEWEAVEDDIPSEAEAQEILLKGFEAEPTDELTASYEEPIDISPGDGRIHAISSVDEYLPAAASRPKKRRAAGMGVGSSLFSSYEGRSPARVNVDYRAFVAGGCFIALAAIFFAGSAVLSESAGTDGSISTLSAKAPAAKELAPPGRPTEVAAVVREETPRDQETEVPSEDLRPEQLRPLTESEPVIRATALPRPRNAAAAKVPKTEPKQPDASPKTAPPAAKVEKMPEVRSTIVISPRNSRVQPRIQMVPRQAGEKRNSDLTRPRIVGNPKP